MSRLRAFIRITAHCISYGLWLIGQIIKESTVMAIDTLGTGRNIAPVVLYYPLRVTKERDIAAFTASITMTPGTLALGITGPKEVDNDALAGQRDPKDASAVGRAEFTTHGLFKVQRFLAVHAMYGSQPQELLDSLAHMEEKLAPHVREHPITVDVAHLVERGRPGPRGFRGSRGGRVKDETVFDVEKLDSTPHAAAFVAAILRQDDEELSIEDLPHLDQQQRYEVAQRNAARAQWRALGAQNKRPMPDINTFLGDKLGESLPDREGRTKPGETLYDPLYPKSNPKEGDIDGSRSRAAAQLRRAREQQEEKARKQGKRPDKH